ncbi:MAG: PAS domain S-box-containing protein [Cyclobacteriaceae bacterium]|jgi:PAS domain S-box-containing protein
MLPIILSCLTLLLLIGFVATLKLSTIAGRPLAGALFVGVIILLVTQQSFIVFHLRDSPDTVALTGAALQWLVTFVLLVSLWPTGRMLLQRREIAGAYEQLLGNMADMYFETNIDGNITLVSASSLSMLGYKPEELIGTSIRSLHASADTFEASRGALVENDGVLNGYLVVLQHRDGHLIQVESNLRWRLDGQGNIAGVEGVTRDITARVLSDQLNSQLGRIVEESLNEVYVFDAETLLFTMVNRGARKNLGYSMSEMRQLTPFSLKPELTRSQFEELLIPLLNGSQGSVLFHAVHRRKDASRYPVEVVLQFFASEERPVFLASIEDVTARRQAETELVQAQRLQSVGQLTGGVAHDFNNMLQALQLNIELIEPAEIEQMAFRDAALRVVDKAAQLTQRLLAFSRRQKLMPRVADVNDILTGIEDLLRLTLGESVEIKLVLSDSPATINVDEGQLENGLLNLALNARDAMDGEGNLTMITRLTELSQDVKSHALASPLFSENMHANEGHQKSPYVEICVSDDGSGMSAEVLKNAVEPFFTTKEVGQGTGLGLSMVYGFVVQSGGHVVIDSAPGKGTSVRLYFPLVDDEPLHSEPTIVEYARTGSETILLIEDEQVVRDITTSTLQSMGYEVISAADGLLALQLARIHAGSIDLILTDVVLAGSLSGPATVERLLESLGPVKVLFMSGYMDDVIHGSRLPEGQQLLAKPFSAGQLQTTIRQVLSLPRVASNHP